ncbi:ABC transporter substrate-binding protein [Marinospirillum celere]|uniref:ABC transporter substrate-binding protein n=1 Tax=Marinospirillum celere TaxID=1122252 RepID=UPI0015A6ADD9|nr:ABC transporter substrate-binding protein [Marinospirillum celere]
MLLVVLFMPTLAVADRVRIELHLMPPHLDPTLTPSATVSEATYNNIYQGLTRINRHGEVKPNLASSWEVSEEGRVYTFTLQPGVRFHNGQPFNAEVAAFSLERLLDPATQNPQRHLFAHIQEIQVVSLLRLQIRLQRPDNLLLFRLGLAAAVMVEPESADNNSRHPIGTGPYEFVSWLEGQPLELAAFQNYWGAQPRIQRASISFTSNRIELEASLSEGAIDLYPNISPLESVVRLASRGDYVLYDGLSEGQTLLAFNHQHPALVDRRVRRAINHAVDKKGLLDIYPKSNPPLIGSHFSPLHPAYLDLSDRYPYDPGKAKKLLAEAGYASGLELTFKVPPPLYARQASLHLSAYLEAVGIRLDVQRVSWSKWLDEVFYGKNYDLTVVAHVEPFDIDIYARDDYYFNYHNPGFDQLWKQIEQEQDEAKRNHLLQQTQLLLAEDAAHVFLHIKPQQSIRKKNLKGFWENSPVPAVILEELYWEN